MKNFILEIGVEELPAKLLAPISNHIKNELENLLKENELSFKTIDLEYTPRRLFFEVHELSEGTEAKDVEIKGPPAKVAIQDGKFSQAALGFAKKNNIAEKDLIEKDGYVYGKAHVPGLSTKGLLEQKLGGIISNTPGERFMRWGYSEIKFSRPLQWILSVLFDDKGSEIVEFAIEVPEAMQDGVTDHSSKLKSSNKSSGHRFLSPEAFSVNNSKEYFAELAKRSVNLNINERKEAIMAKTQELAKSVGGTARINEDLLEEVLGLIETPFPVLCKFDESFLELPGCVSITAMEEHQRYFPILKEGELLPYFVTVSNNPLPDAQQNIKEGNEKVIIPRLKDAEFFFNEDNKIKLEERLDKLSQINFQSGTMRQKAERIQEISKYIAYELSTTYDLNPEKAEGEKLDKSTREDIAKAALLAKTDLTSQMVFEFTELQGEIGGIYAAKQGYSQTIAKAIEEQYMPRFAGDKLPGNIGAKIISIADRIDNLVTIFALGKIPKGSSDPFALRRQANGLLEILIHCHLILNLDKLVDFAIDTAEAQLKQGKMIKKSKGKGENKKTFEVPELDWASARSNVKDFLKERMEFVFEFNHKNTTVNKAVLATGNSLADPNKKHMMIHFVSELGSEAGFDKFAEAANRIMKIGNKELGDIVDPNKFVNDSEKELFETLKKLDKLHHLKIVNDVPLSSEEVFVVTEPINSFFDNVMVNDENEDLKKNRHALVNQASSLLEEIADFTMIG